MCRTARTSRLKSMPIPSAHVATSHCTSPDSKRSSADALAVRRREYSASVSALPAPMYAAALTPAKLQVS